MAEFELNEQDAQKIADGFDVLLKLQKKYQEKHEFDFWNLEPEKKREMFIRTLFCAMGELIETGDNVNKWWKKDNKDPLILEKKSGELLEEMIDSLHFFLVALLILGAKGNDVKDSYLNKLGINFNRQKDEKLGYI